MEFGIPPTQLVGFGRRSNSGGPRLHVALIVSSFARDAPRRTKIELAESQTGRVLLIAPVPDQLVKCAAATANQCTDTGALTAMSNRADARPHGSRSGNPQDHIPGRVPAPPLCIIPGAGNPCPWRVSTRIAGPPYAGCTSGRRAILVTIPVSCPVAILVGCWIRRSAVRISR